MSSLRDFHVFPNSLVMGPGIVRVGGSYIVGVNKVMAVPTMTVSAPALWTPAEITTALWLDAADYSTLTIVDGYVSQIGDKSSNGIDFAMGITTQRPGYVIDNGMPFIHFAGDDYLSAGDKLDLGTGSLLLYFALRFSDSNGENAVLVKSPFAALTGRYGVIINSSAKFNTFYEGASTYGVLSSSHPGTSLMLAASRIDRELGSIQNIINCVVNGSYSFTPDTANDRNTSFRLLLGARAGTTDSTEQYYSRMYIGEIVGVRDASSTATRQLIEGYLAHKWGLVVSLPSNHPYKSAAPTA